MLYKIREKAKFVLSLQKINDVQSEPRVRHVFLTSFRAIFIKTRIKHKNCDCIPNCTYIVLLPGFMA